MTSNPTMYDFTRQTEKFSRISCVWRAIYNLLLWCGFTLGLPVIFPLVLCSQKWRRTFLPRLGITLPLTDAQRHAFQADEGQPIWIHAVSVGEIITIEPLIKAIRGHHQTRPIVLSTATQTGFALAWQLFGDDLTEVIFFPFDLPICVKRIIAAINPALVMIVEHDIWPNFLFELNRRNVPVMLVNAKLSDKTFAGRQRVSFLMKPVFAAFAAVCVQSERDAERFRILGVPANRLNVTGSLKFDQIFIPCSEEECTAFKRSLGLSAAQKIFVAGSTHPGEECILAEVLRRLKRQFTHLTCLIAPRNPQRARKVSRIFQAAGLVTRVLSENQRHPGGDSTDVLVIDTIGLLKRLYAISDCVFIGGSLVRRGGHNPVEPAAYAKPIFFGPHTSNFDDIAQLFERAGGAIRISNGDQLYECAVNVLTDPETAHHIGQQAFQVYRAHQGAVERTLHVLIPLMI